MAASLFFLLIFCILLSVTDVNSCSETNKKEACKLPDIIPPKLEYIKVTSNCVDEAFRNSTNTEWKTFYRNLNKEFWRFLKLTRGADDQLESYKEYVAVLIEKYVNFKKFVVTELRNCKESLSWKNLVHLLSRFIDIQGYFKSVTEAEFSGEILGILRKRKNSKKINLAFNRNEVLNCIIGNYEHIKNCTEQHFVAVPKRIKRPGFVYDPRSATNKATKDPKPQRKTKPPKKMELAKSVRCK